jgi:hypothetical protein
LELGGNRWAVALILRQMSLIFAPLSFNRMKRLMVNWMVVAGCLFICVGCASVKPSQEQQASVVTPPAKNYAMVGIIKNWWETPPPDFPEASGNSALAWYYVGLVLAGFGPCLNK